MTRILLTIFGALAFCLQAHVAAGDMELITPKRAVAQGEVILVVTRGVATDSRVEGSWQGEALEFFKMGEREFGSLVGIDFRLTPGPHPVEVRARAKNDRHLVLSSTLEVKKTDYRVQHLSLPEGMVTLDAETLARVRREAGRFSALWGKRSQERYWRGGFIVPVPGRVTTAFGLRRMLNGKPRSPHSGVDLRAALGEPVLAPNRGQVVLVGEFYFHGRAVVVDHGWGLYTMYFHLSQVNVSEGDVVDKSATIGLAGSTGRSTAPHLHWGVRLGGARVDPFALMRATAG